MLLTSSSSAAPFSFCLQSFPASESFVMGHLFHEIFQARILEWVAISFCRASSWCRDQTCVSCLAGGFFTTEPPGRPPYTCVCVYVYIYSIHIYIVYTQHIYNINIQYTQTHRYIHIYINTHVVLSSRIKNLNIDRSTEIVFLLLSEVWFSLALANV